MKTTFDVQTRPLDSCAGGDLIFWDDNKLALVITPAEDKRSIIDLESFAQILTRDQHGETAEVFDCVPVFKEWKIDLAIPPVIAYANNAKLGDICLHGKDVYLAYTAGARFGFYLVNISNGESVIADKLSKVAIFNSWTILIENPSCASTILLKERKPV